MRKGFTVNLKRALKVNDNDAVILTSGFCYLCASSCYGRNALCCACLDDLLLNTKACPACGRADAADRICAGCLEQSWPHIDTTWCLFQYHYPVNHLIHAMKFKQGIDVANYLGKILAKAYSLEQKPLPDCIIPIPLHTSRLIARGYNQSVELARPLSRQLGLPLKTASCKRVRATLPQTDLPAKKRKRNVRNAFAVTGNIACDHVLLIDDVITTGSTVNELARTLRLAGVSKVDVLACARTS